MYENYNERFFGFFSVTFGKIPLFSGRQRFPAKKYLLGPVLSDVA
jgi:hypothetical protein